MTTRTFFSITCSVLCLVFITACSTPRVRNESINEAPGAMHRGAAFGDVTSIEVVPVEARTSGGGVVLGAVLGAVVGNQIGSGNGRAAATGLGAVGGAVIGNRIEQRNQRETDVYRVRVRLDNGRVEQFDYRRIDDLRVGDRVKVEGGQLYRL